MLRSAAPAPLPPSSSPDGAATSAEPLELPAPWHPPARPGVPILASVIPVLGAVGLWAVTGSVLTLWFAALGPLIAGATMLDGIRGARRERRRAESRARSARARVASQIGQRHADERARRWARHPDVAAFLARDGEIWRPVPGRGHALVVGAGTDRSEVRVTGGGDDPESVQLRARAARLEHAPVVVAAASGIAIVGRPVLAGAVARALAIQLCMALPPGELRIIGPLRGEDAWAERLPHRQAGTGTALCLVGAGQAIPPGAEIAIVRAEVAPPPACGSVLTVISPGRAHIDAEGDVREIAVEALSLCQAATLADELAARAARLLGTARTPETVALAPLLADAPTAARGRLPAVIGHEAGETFVIDLVADGPHAVVAGVTGAGKSELLVTWVVALCATHSTSEVSFLLADFKGGTAFDALAGIPHVTGVLTDLDGAGARRAIESLRAEVRWRETELSRAGARDVLDPRVVLPRLVIVVDEFAALLGEHPELHAVFTDVAARGRALGMHLVLGTQRPSGVVRESLLANCPLRISLRVTDAQDSRVILGSEEAASLPGGAAGRGLALVRAAADPALRRVRIALSSAADVEAVVRSTDGPVPRRPWLPELPDRVEVEDLVAAVAHPRETLLIGLADEPDQQRQRPVGVGLRERGLLIVGAGGSGKTTALRTLAGQAPGEVHWVPSRGEEGWDAVCALARHTPAPASLVVLDDLDALASALPLEYSRELVERLERLVRGAGSAGIFVAASAQRLVGAVARLADLLPHRLMLAAASRAEYVTAGGDPAHYAPGSPPGRGRLDGRAVQVATGPAQATVRSRTTQPWHPDRPLTGVVLRRSPAARGVLSEWARQGASVLSLDEYSGETEWAAGPPIVVAGDAEEWQRHWRALSTIRSDHDFVVESSFASELRLLTGERALPPYCDPGAPRAWLLRAGGAPERIVLPAEPEQRRY
ncbi:MULTISPECIES: FtsK/SpoIIIE domain-containing protein [unclassified Microbacterium]|uniref:FtsK/SpoIIIE domain-containing protein n=1 Tax=unclassified Microbacterium TaxID=2609290 RepID=UPI00214C12AA|nr:MULTISPECIES: FtsK/SpoIIIE domain-containing protein [unclassified Microbacterium]MCR2810118.1 FtsK/SpoIIIE domain-containing protein [Microbacterium sp. zg.B185]WIM20045.1 FtsK/SpoIIIE domain-containing protein [Microbacterium sp. zg-B185]